MTSADVLRRWHDAVEAADVDGTVACCSTDVGVRGPRGVGHGHDLVRGWLQPIQTWCVFTVADDRVTSIARYETADEVPPA